MAKKVNSIRCPNRECNHLLSAVKNSRPTEHFIAVRRRRECLKCGTRWSTYEIDAHKYTTIIPFLDYADRLELIRDLLTETLQQLQPFRTKTRDGQCDDTVVIPGRQRNAPKSSNLP